MAKRDKWIKTTRTLTCNQKAQDDEEEVSLSSSSSSSSLQGIDVDDVFETQGEDAIHCTTTATATTRHDTSTAAATQAVEWDGLDYVVVTAQLKGHDKAAAAILQSASPEDTHINQDAVLVATTTTTCVPPSPKQEPNATSSSSSSSSYWFLASGVMDGHDMDGAFIARYVQQQIPNRLEEKLHNTHCCCNHDGDDDDDDDEYVKTALREIFCDLHDSLSCCRSSLVGGTTASIVLLLSSKSCNCATKSTTTTTTTMDLKKKKKKLYIANVGDSVTCVAVQNKIVYQTLIDRPDVPQEEERIVTMGGKITTTTSSSSSSLSCCQDNTLTEQARVMYPVVIENNDNNDDNNNNNVIWKPGIAMSRSIGDYDMVGVIPEPVVDVLDIGQLLLNHRMSHSSSSSYILIVSATDGMTDCIPPTELVQALSSSLQSCEDRTNSTYEEHPAAAAAIMEQDVKTLVCRAANEWKRKSGGTYRDDITLVVTYIKYKSMIADS